jgi:hypothetical protein
MIIVCEEVGNFILSQTANTVLVYYREANFLSFYLFYKHRTNIDIHTHTITHPYEHTHTHYLYEHIQKTELG